jgi:hypothetical protein
MMVMMASRDGSVRLNDCGRRKWSKVSGECVGGRRVAPLQAKRTEAERDRRRRLEARFAVVEHDRKREREERERRVSA